MRWLESLRTQPERCSKLLWGLRAEQWAATSLVTQGRPTKEGGNEQSERGDSKEIAIEGDTTGDSTCLYKTSETLLIYYKEFYPKGIVEHEAYMRHATRHIQGRHEATLITTSE